MLVVLVSVYTGKGMACIPDQCIHNYVNINSYAEINLTSIKYLYVVAFCFILTDL